MSKTPISRTPRTDAASYAGFPGYRSNDDFARQLERELNEAREQLAAMYYQHRCGCGHTACRRCRDDRDCERVLGIDNEGAK
jgi:hypothetical protein